MEDAVHPRVCGELDGVRLPLREHPGSSPRVRGTRRIEDQREEVVRFIPACAGNSHCRYSTRPGMPVHPRVCGELTTSVTTSKLPVGSSPRVRGTHPARRHARRRRRFIPACAGNSSRLPRGPRVGAVHPRVCGELADRRPFVGAPLGSSPRVRGTLPTSKGRAAGLRFIPACAGNSAMLSARMAPTPVHPRVCGELVVDAGASPALAGSSPRVRGTRWPLGSPPCRPPVHPRVCGELLVGGPGTRTPSGSSPRVRGTLCNTIFRVPTNRFIPACAGNSCKCTWLAKARTVHPRVCGELRAATAADLAGDGSSPRVRGTRAHRVLRRGGGRFIPACAGNSCLWSIGASAISVHPRVCGELPRRSRGERQHRRFIPACAGNSAR